MKQVSRMLLVILLWAPLAHARTTKKWDYGWKFHLGDTPSASQLRYDDASWRLLDVPHDWGVEGAYKEDNPGGGVSAYLPSGIGWYRKSFNISPAMLKQSVWIVFDGVFMDSTVWINGYKLGTRPYGYISFAYQLSGHLHEGENVISVRVNNQLQPAARWYTGSGIYGHVHLVTANPIHIPQWSTFVRTLSMTGDRAVVAVSASVEGGPSSKSKLKLQYDLVDAQGRVVASRSTSLSQSEGRAERPLEMTIGHPELWSPDAPVLYTLRARVLSGRQVLDEIETPFGIRAAVFDADRGFLLNGSPLKIKGVADHLYGGPMGSAVPDTILVRRLQLLKDMGVNAIRTSHNPHRPVFYDLCDKMGFLVIDEIFDGWHRKATEDYGGRFFKAWWQKDVRDWVMRDRNHPSIILWSIGNETGLSDQFGITGFIHTIDPTRPTTGGQVLYGVDVAGFNGPGEVPGVLDKFHKEHPKTPIVLTEEPHTLQTRGYYRVRTWWRDWKHINEFPAYGTNEIFFDGKQWFNSSYDNAISKITARASWKQVAAAPWISGEFRWCGFDYLGEAPNDRGRWPDRAMNYGIIDLAGIPKDDYYLYQSLWTTEPMVHVLPSWTHRGMKEIIIPVVAYSNQPEVELFLNGRSLGRHNSETLGDFLWKVPYEPGTLKAVAYSPSGKVTASETLVTAGIPESITLETDNGSLKDDRTDTAVVTFTAVDKNDQMVPWDMNRVDFKVSGPVRVLGYDNGDSTDVTPNRASWRRMFYGMGRGFYQSTAATGPIEVTALSILGDEAFGVHFRPSSRIVAIAVNRVALRGTINPAKLEIRYTIDGSKPSATSPLYTQPFSVKVDTLVRAVAIEDSKPLLETSTTFRKVDRSLVSDPRWATDSQVDPVTPIVRPD